MVLSIDWRQLHDELKRAGFDRVVIVGDHDAVGRKALPQISRLLGLTADHLIFTEPFGLKFDLADKFPAKPPTMAECVLPGTWMTFLRANEQGRPTPLVTEPGARDWAYIPDCRLFVHVRYPWLQYEKERLDAFLAPLSHTPHTSRLIEAAPYAAGRPMRLAYDPGKPAGVISDGESTALNCHRPARIRSREGDASLWLEFLAYICPDPIDRAHLERWCATLIAKPGVRILFGLLLISETQGVGKSTLGNILAEVIGLHNASFPNQTDITSEFNEWLYQRRLAVINEVYAGHSWAGYNALKNAVTEPAITLNQKFQRKVIVANWIHIIACSNSYRALKLASEDRRWFVPKIAEEKWPRKKFKELRVWLENGGYGEVVCWARAYGNYFEEGESAPMSNTKEEVIAAGRSDGAAAIVRLAEAMAANSQPMAVTAKAVKEYARQEEGGRLVEGEQELLRLMKQYGPKKAGRLKINGSLETVLANQAALAALKIAPEGAFNATLVGFIQKPGSICPPQM